MGCLNSPAGDDDYFRVCKLPFGAITRDPGGIRTGAR